MSGSLLSLNSVGHYRGESHLHMCMVGRHIESPKVIVRPLSIYLFIRPYIHLSIYAIPLAVEVWGKKPFIISRLLSKRSSQCISLLHRLSYPPLSFVVLHSLCLTRGKYSILYPLKFGIFLFYCSLSVSLCM